MAEGTTVLVIDDSPALRRLVDFVLSQHQFTVYRAHDGETGLLMARELRPRLIVVDLVLPGMNGYIFSKSLRSYEELRDTPIILITLSDSRGADNWKNEFEDIYTLLKPFEPDDLVRLAHKALSQPREAKEGRKIRGAFSEDEREIIGKAVQRYFQTGFPRLMDEMMPRLLAAYNLDRNPSLIWSGNIAQISLADILNFADNARLSGRLSVISGSAFGDILLDQGAFVFASVNRRGQHRFMTDIIMEDRHLDREMVTVAVEEARERSVPVGSVLVESGILAPEELVAYLKMHAREALNMILELTEGMFYLERVPLPPDFQDTRLKAPLLEVLFEGLRVLDEKRVAASELDDHSVVFSRFIADDETMEAISLDEKESTIFALVNGKRTLEDIIQASGLHHLEVKRICHALLKVGLLRKKRLIETPPSRS